MLYVVFMFTACTDTSVRLDELASSNGFSQMTVTGTDFQHRIYYRQGLPAKNLHIYLEGDGRPWRNEFTVSIDPSVDRLISLELMKQDAASVLYVGRPCYHGFANVAPCRPWYWTSGRYSQEIVDSMLVVIRNYAQQNGALNVVLIGHSGGGTLAMLIAEHLENVIAVVTLAGNLDVNRWAKHHEYAPLEGSMSPADRQPLPHAIKQLHYAGEDDSKIPYDFVRDAVLKQIDAEFILLDDVNHDCCWADYWPVVLKRLESFRLEGLR